MTATYLCAGPPPDFSKRAVPVCDLHIAALSLRRIHRSIYSPIFFNRRSTSSTVFRFDAPNNEFGVLYAAPTFSACMFETVIRNVFEGGSLPLLIDQAELSCRSISSLIPAMVRTLHLADFTQSLAPLGGDNTVMSMNDYTVPNKWSLAVHSHPEKFDGIYFRSRYANEPCVALFDRVEMIARGAAIPILACSELDAFLDQYHIGLL